MIRLNNTRGFSVVELLVVLTVTTMLVIVITTFMMKNLQQSTLASTKATIIRETEQSLDLVANDIRLSANADINNRWPDINSPSGSTNQWSWQSNGSTLVLATAVQDKNGNVIFSDSKNYITEKNNLIYFVKNGTLYKRTVANPVSGNSAVTSCPIATASASCPVDKELLHNVTSFTVAYKDGDNNTVTATNARSIELGVTVNKHLYAQNISASYTTRMVFRND